mmetsp:Transcript_1150/g.1863  ORF Transcript_1150/g.1863 Transcript_1150/m.1863 type:complete len:83 (-) Transcript_1150:32-280(-)
MKIADKLIGLSLVGASVFIFLYYTTWVFVVPYLDKSNILNSWFPPHQYAIAIPATLLVFGIVLISLFVSYVFIKQSRKKKHQ